MGLTEKANSIAYNRGGKLFWLAGHTVNSHRNYSRGPHFLKNALIQF